MPDHLSPTGYALLGLLSVRPFTTYELAKQVERSLGWFWPRTERKLYDEAKKLAALELATTTTGRTGKRERTVYAISPAGARALAGWLAQDSAPLKLESEAMVRVFFADAGSLADLRATLEGVAEGARRSLEVLALMTAPMGEPDYPFASRRHLNVLALHFQIAHHRTALSWAQWALDQVAQWPSTADPGTWDWRAALERLMPPVPTGPDGTASS